MSPGSVMNYFNGSNTMELLLFLLIVIIIGTLIKISCNRDDGFTLRDLVSVDGKLDEKKFTRFGAWVLSSWGFIYLLVSKPETFPEWYFTVYMGAWVLNVIADKYFNGPSKNASLPETSIRPPIQKP